MAYIAEIELPILGSLAFPWSLPRSAFSAAGYRAKHFPYVIVLRISYIEWVATVAATPVLRS